MTLTAEEVSFGYRMFLQRFPNSEEVERMIRNIETVDAMRDTFLASPEFHRKANLVPRQKTATKDQVLIHLHIPKTAGTSLTKLLTAQYEKKEYVTVNEGSVDQLKTLTAPQIKQLKLIFGHLPYGTHERIPQSPQYVCVLRKPGERIYSFYRYLLRDVSNPIHKTLVAKNPSFGEFLEFARDETTLRPAIDNGQIRQLAGKTGVPSLSHEPTLLRAALSNILRENFTYGFTEEFEDFQDRLLKKGFISEKHDVRENAASDGLTLQNALEHLSDSQTDLYNAFTSWDGYLYDICHGLYHSTT